MLWYNWQSTERNTLRETRRNLKKEENNVPNLTREMQMWHRINESPDICD